VIRLLPWFIAGSLAFAGAAQWYGYRAGYDAAVAEQQARDAKAAARELSDLSADIEAEQARMELQAKRDIIALQLEDQANAEPISNDACLPLSRVRRLQIR